MLSKRSGGLNQRIEKDREISNSLTASYMSASLFGVFSLIRLPITALEASFINILILLLCLLILIQSILNIKALKKLRKDHADSPERFASYPVIKPILYTAVFWFLPKA